MDSTREKRLTRNIVLPIAQVVISGGVLFVLYRYLYDQLGVAQIGIWSLVMAASSVSRIGELGLSAGVVRFVAQALGRNDARRAALVIQTTAVTLGFVVGLALLAVYPLASFLLPYLLPDEEVSTALEIVPLALGSVWLMVMTSVFSGGLDGCLRMDIRSMLMAGSHVLYLGLAFMLVPRLGLQGIAWAQLGQYGVLATCLWVALRAQLKSLPWIPAQWRKALLVEMFGYGLRFQVITIVNMLFDPMVKVLMSRFGGLDALGFYEMANNLILKLRALIVEGSRVMVPSIASLGRSESAQTKRAFLQAYTLNYYVSILLFGLLGIATVPIAIIWLGDRQHTFILFALLLQLGWFCNTLIGPAYFSNLGLGDLRENMASHVISSLVTVIATVVLGAAIGAMGVVMAVAIGLISGSIFLVVAFMKKMLIAWGEFIIPNGFLRLLIGAITLTLISTLLLPEHSSLAAQGILTLICAFALIGLMFTHPEKAVIFAAVARRGRQTTK